MTAAGDMTMGSVTIPLFPSHEMSEVFRLSADERSCGSPPLLATLVETPKLVFAHSTARP
jgi:hypothetical protein